MVTLAYLFQSGDTPPCLKAADADDTGGLNLTDAVYLLSFLFMGGEPLPTPAACGWDPTIDDLTCESYPPCSAGP